MCVCSSFGINRFWWRDICVTRLIIKKWHLMMQTFWLLVLFEMLNFPPRVSGTRAGLCVLALLDLVPTLRRLSEIMPKWSPDLHTICISKACVFNTCIYGINTFNNVFTAMKCSIIPVFTATTCSMHCVYGNDKRTFHSFATLINVLFTVFTPW